MGIFYDVSDEELRRILTVFSNCLRDRLSTIDVRGRSVLHVFDECVESEINRHILLNGN